MARSALSTRLARLERDRDRRGCPMCGPSAPITFRLVDGEHGNVDHDDVCDGCGRTVPQLRFAPMTFGNPALERRLMEARGSKAG